jgi:hypothetical protein
MGCAASKPPYEKRRRTGGSSVARKSRRQREADRRARADGPGGRDQSLGDVDAGAREAPPPPPVPRAVVSRHASPRNSAGDDPPPLWPPRRRGKAAPAGDGQPAADTMSGTATTESGAATSTVDAAAADDAAPGNPLTAADPSESCGSSTDWSWQDADELTAAPIVQLACPVIVAAAGRDVEARDSGEASPFERHARCTSNSDNNHRRLSGSGRDSESHRRLSGSGRSVHFAPTVHEAEAGKEQRIAATQARLSSSGVPRPRPPPKR